MKLILFPTFFVFLGCAVAMRGAPDLAVTCDRTIYVECVNEPGMEAAVLAAICTLPVKGLQVYLHPRSQVIEIEIAYRESYNFYSVGQRLRATSGVLNVTINDQQ